MRREDGEVPVLADLDRPDPIVDAEVVGRVQGDHLEGVLFGHAAVLDRLGGFHVHPPDPLVRVRVQRDGHAALVHDRHVVGDGVPRLHLVAPEIRERARARAMGRDLVGHLVALEHVLQRPDPEPEVFRDPQQHQDLVGAVRVGVNEDVARQDLGQRFEPEVAPRCQQVLAARSRRLVLVPVGLVLPGVGEALAQCELDAHPGARVAPIDAGNRRTTRPCRVLAECELHAPGHAAEQQFVGRLAPAHLQDGVLAADGVRRSVQHIDRRDTAGQCPEDRLVTMVDDVDDPDLWRDRVHAFVAAPLDRHVRVGVEEAGCDPHAGGVDFPRPGRHHDLGVRPDGGDRAILDDDGPAGDRAVRGCQDGSVPHCGHRHLAAEWSVRCAALALGSAWRLVIISVVIVVVGLAAAPVIVSFGVVSRTVHPDGSDARLRVENIPFDRDDVGRLADLERADDVAHAEDLGRRDGQRAERPVPREAGVDGGTEVLEKVIRVVQPGSGEGHGDAGRVQPAGVRLRVLDVLGRGIVDRIGPGAATEADRALARAKIERDQHRAAGRAQSVGGPPALDRTADDHVKAELVGEPERPENLVLGPGGEDDRLVSARGRLKRFQSWIVGGPVDGRRLGAVAGPRLAVPARVQVVLADRRHDAHERPGVLAA